ncbi:hypothetical protein IH970_02485 [candidate division KSB1 bacterium]|nr:hypothetical protein [candidate division KSB1 bacterium]
MKNSTRILRKAVLLFVLLQNQLRLPLSSILVHLNPNVQEAVRRILSPRDNIYLIEPLPYYRLFQ